MVLRCRSVLGCQKVPGKVPPRSRQGSTKVAPRFQQGFTKQGLAGCWPCHTRDLTTPAGLYRKAPWPSNDHRVVFANVVRSVLICFSSTAFVFGSCSANCSLHSSPSLLLGPKLSELLTCLTHTPLVRWKRPITSLLLGYSLGLFFVTNNFWSRHFDHIRFERVDESTATCSFRALDLAVMLDCKSCAEILIKAGANTSQIVLDVSTSTRGLQGSFGDFQALREVKDVTTF